MNDSSTKHSDPSAYGSTDVSLDGLIALNREIIALEKARMPLEPGLLRVASSFDRPTGQLASRLSQALSSGKTLEQALQTQEESLPKLYTAIARVGASAGQLHVGLEQFATIASDVASLRRTIVLAAIYPLGLLLLAWMLALGAVSYLLPGFAWIDSEPSTSLETMQRLLFGPAHLAIVVPVVILLAACFVAWRTSRAGSGLLSGRINPARLPVIGRGYRLAAQACFAGLLRVLSEHQIPLPKALRLASDATGWRELAQAAHSVADDVTTGSSIDGSQSFAQLPALVRLAFCKHADAASQTQMLQAAANAYRQQSKAWSSSVATYAPVIGTGLLGGAITAGYGLLVLQPYFNALYSLSFPS